MRNGSQGWKPAKGPLHADVVVVGGGAAGAMAALAARSSGVSVALVRRAYGATALSSGAIDLAPDPFAGLLLPLGGRSSLAACIESMAAIHPRHPYAILREQVEVFPEALQFAEEKVEGLSFADFAQENRCLPTTLGALKLTGGGLSSILGSDLSSARGAVGLVGFPNHVEYDAPLWARASKETNERARLSCTLVPVVCNYLDHRDDPLLRPFEIAKRIEEDPKRLADAVRRASPAGIQRLIFPPVLARGDPAGVLAVLEEALSVPCSELLASRLSVPGLRLQAFLDTSLEREGVRLVAGEVVAKVPRDVTSLRLRDASPRAPPWENFLPDVEGVEDEIPDWEIRANTFILATGKFLGGGIRRDGILFEPILHLPIRLRGKVSSWVGNLSSAVFKDDQAVFQSGLCVDERLRPLDEGGALISSRLFACGDLLAGHDPAKDGTGMGLAFITGYLAGLHAAKGVH